MLLLLTQIALALPLSEEAWTVESIPWDGVDLSTVGTPLSVVGDDDVETITLPFSFPYFDGSYDEVTVGYNGGLAFERRSIPFANGDLALGFGVDMPDISCWWDDLYPASAILWWYDAAHDRVIISWDDIASFNYQSGTISFQAMLYANGDVECHDEDVVFGDATIDQAASATIGLIDQTGDYSDAYDVVQVSYEETQSWLVDGTAIRFSPVADGDGDGFRGFDCDDTSADSGDVDGDLVPDACDACPTTSPRYELLATRAECEPGYGEVTLFTGLDWTGDCMTFSVGAWTQTRLVAAGMADDTALSVLVGPYTEATMYQDAELEGVTYVRDADDADVSALGLSSMFVRVTSSASVDEPGCIDADLCDDSDGDGVCDDLDICDGDDATGDSDADGVCDSDDLCVGDDVTGDTDGDGVCDDQDFSLRVGQISAGAQVELVATNARVSSQVYFLLGTTGRTPSGLCYPGAPDVCTGIDQPRVLGSAAPARSGTARLTVTVPSTVPAGVTVWLQAVWVRTSGGVVVGDVTPVERTVTR
ncbi:MAG TPA: hypothetical protein PKA64_23085 [Myxococcota bacterium]|nr:hypothetical protein [Myxococcota bacterium]